MQFPPPPEVLATWPAPNYENPESRGPSLLIIEIITLLIALIALAIRLYVKFVLLRKPALDDYCMIIAGLSAIGLTITVILANTIYGWNHHIWDLTFDDLVIARKVSLTAQVLYLFSSTMSKISILISYINLAVPDSKFSLFSKITIVLISMSNFSIFVVLFAQCTPVSSYWNILRVSEDCHIREGHFLMAQAGMTVIADLAVWVLPLPTLYKAKLPLRQRLGLILLFSFGAVVVIAAALRTYWLWWAVIISWDMTWECFDEWIWTAVEVHLSIMCGCVPWLRSLVNLRREKRRKETERTAGYKGSEQLGSGSYALEQGTGGRSKKSKNRSRTAEEGDGPGDEYPIVSPGNTYTVQVDAKGGSGPAVAAQEWWDKGNESRDSSDGAELIFQRPGDSLHSHQRS
ncbi:hypothetical protein V8F20_009221 [Naviculisporaceae sp. PSN 640]